MGEALPESLSFPHAKARALLEVVRLAFEGGIGFGSESAGANGTAATVESDLLSGPASSSIQNPRGGKELMQQVHVHASHRPASAGSSSRLVPGGPCMWCGVTATPQWRRPRGTNKLLCNACGIFFTRYGRLPEKSQHLHSSNAHAAAGQNMSMAGPVAGLGAIDCVAKHAESQPEQSYSTAKTDGESTASGSRTRMLQLGQPQQPTGISPHKRKGAPQPEVELLHGLDDSTAGAGGNCPASLTAARPVITTAPSLCATPQRPSPGTSPEQQSMPVPVAAAPAVAPDGCDVTALLPDTAAQASTMLAVVPLDLGLHQVALVDQPLGCLATLPPLCLNSAAAAATTPGSGTSCTAAYGSATMAPATGKRSPATVTVLPQELLGRPFALPAGLLPGGVALLDAAAAAGIQPPPRSLYARPSKRQERLPAGDSEDSNISTDSHTGPHGETGTSHDEDDGGWITTTTTTSTTHALRGLSSSPPSLPSLHFPPALFGRPMAVPMLTAPTGTLSVGPGASGLGAVGAVGLTVGFAAGGGVAVAPSVPIGGQGLPEQQQQPVIFLQTRRSKGPRSRASSATPSSSTQS